MPSGRPKKGTTNRLTSLVQFQYLCGSLELDEKGLAAWLRKLPEGSMADRDIANFIHHESTIQIARCLEIDKYAPGFHFLSCMPWQELSNARRDLKLTRIANRKISTLQFPSGRVALPCSSATQVQFHRIANAEEWIAVRYFFQTVIRFRLCERNGDLVTNMQLAKGVIESLSNCLTHPTMNLLRREISYCTSTLLGKSLYGAFHLMYSWRALESEYRILGAVFAPSTLIDPRRSHAQFVRTGRESHLFE